eukprot:m.338826 g.338826  ORF g.338826 m.338826 type:complete len:516 (-) comp18561_c0_seq1:356-1903(-)
MGFISTDTVVLTVQTLGAYLSVCVVGAALAKFPRENPLLTKTFLKQLGQLTLQALLPALMFSTLAQNMSFSVMKESFPVFWWGFASQGVNSLVALLLRCLVPMPKRVGRLFSLAMVYGNAGSLPLVIVETLVRQSPLSSYDGALEKLTTFIFVYITAWSLSFWSFGLVYLRKGWETEENVAPPETTMAQFVFGAPLDTQEEAHEGGENVSVDQGKMSQVELPEEKEQSPFYACLRSTFGILINPIMLSIILGTLCGMITPIRHALYTDDDNEEHQPALQFLGSALETLGKPAVGASVLVMAGSLGGFIDQYFKNRKLAKEKRSQEETSGIEEQKNSIEQGGNNTSSIVEVEPGQIVVFLNASTTETEKEQSIEAHADSISEIVSSEENSSTPSDSESEERKKWLVEEGQEETKNGIPTRVLLALLLGRVVICAAINLALVFLFADHFLEDSEDSKLIKLVLAIEAATPSAEVMIVLCQQHNEVPMAESLAASYVLQYLLSMLPLAAGIALSINEF